MELKKHILLGLLVSQIFFSITVRAADTDTPPPGPPPGGMGRGHFDDNDALLKKARESGNSDIRDFVMAQMKKGDGPQALQDSDFRKQLQAKLDALDAKAQDPVTKPTTAATTTKKSTPPPPPPLAASTKNHALTPDEAKKLVRGFGGVIDQENKKALLAGQIPQVCAAHFKVTADSQPDANNLFAFAIIDTDGGGMACLSKHKNDTCDNSHACTNLRDINPNARIDVADDLLDKAHVALHSGAVTDTPPPAAAATEAGTVCNCTAQVPGPGPQDSITKLMKDLGVDDDKSSKHDRPKKDDDGDDTDKPDKPGHDRPGKGDKDKSDKDDDKEMADLDRQLAQLLDGRSTGTNGMNQGMNQNQNMNSGMMMSSGMSGMNGMSGMGSNNMSNYYSQMMMQQQMMQQQQQQMMQQMMMGSMSGMSGMSGMGSMMGSGNSMTNYYAQLMQQQQQQQIMQQMMMGSGLSGMSGLSGISGLGYTNPLYSGLTGNSILGTSLANTSTYGGSITGGSIGTTAASVYSPYNSIYRYSATGR